MLRGWLPTPVARHDDPHPFRLRGTEISRLEGFSDAVFGFALTLLVVSLEPARTYPGLIHDLRQIPIFAFCFALLLLIWLEHNHFFRRYGMRDPLTVFLNALLLFVVLFYVYPLKFMGTVFLGPIVGVSLEARDESGTIVPMLTGADLPGLYTIFAVGFGLVTIIQATMYLNALRHRDVLALDTVDIFDTWTGVLSQGLMLAACLLSIVVASIAGNSPWPGMMYWLIGPAMWVLHMTRWRRRVALARSFAAGG